MSFYMKQNDTVPPLEVQLVDGDGNPLNLDLCGVKFVMRDGFGKVRINRPAEIVDAEKGMVRVNWQEGDTKEVGEMKCEFKVDFPDGKVMTVPNDSYFILHIVASLE